MNNCLITTTLYHRFRIQIVVDFTTKNIILDNMQLYHSNHITIHSNTLQILDTKVIHQLKRVMRSRIGDHITIQSDHWDHTIRYLCTITKINDISIETTTIETTDYPHSQHHKHLVVAMSNKWDKMELIVQKATECGITHISIIPMHRSIIRQSNANKIARLESIMIEAVEQSWSSQIPVLQRHDHWDHLTLSWQVMLSNMGGQVMSEITKQSQVTLIVWPEWGIDPRDIKILESKDLNFTTISLWLSVLRMETAAIVGSWWICNE